MKDICLLMNGEMENKLKLNLNIYINKYLNKTINQFTILDIDIRLDKDRKYRIGFNFKYFKFLKFKILLSIEQHNIEQCRFIYIILQESTINNIKVTILNNNNKTNKIKFSISSEFKLANILLSFDQKDMEKERERERERNEQ